MRFLAAALVVVALLAGDLVSDLQHFTGDTQKGWNTASFIGLFIFALLVMFADDEKHLHHHYDRNDSKETD